MSGHPCAGGAAAECRLTPVACPPELTRYIFRKARPKVRSLLGEEEEDVAEPESGDAEGAEGAGAAAGDGDADAGEGAADYATDNSTLSQDVTLNYWKPSLSLRLVHDFTAIPSSAYPEALQKGAVPAAARLYYAPRCLTGYPPLPCLRPEMILDRVTGHYFPTLYVNEFWLLREHLIEINDTTVELPLDMNYNTYTMMYWQLQLQMEESFRTQQAFGASSHGDLDEFKVWAGACMPTGDKGLGPGGETAAYGGRTHSPPSLSACSPRPTPGCWASPRR